MRFRAFCHIQHFSRFISPSALQKRRVCEFIVVSLHVQSSLASTHDFELLDPMPARAATISPCLVTAADNSANNPCTSGETATEQSALPGVWKGYEVPHRGCRTPVHGRCNKDSGRGEGSHRQQRWVLRSYAAPSWGWEILPAANTSHGAQRQGNQQSHVYIKPFVKLSQQIPSINSAPLALAIQRGLIKLRID